jgi:predicted lipid-binding transport protein (Tim44 family)
MQLAERGETESKTHVEWLDAEVLACADEDNRHIVSVRFSGQIRESADGEAAAFNEIWHLSKPASGSGGWVIAGIQQG